MTHPLDFRHCPPCEVASLDDACWMCGQPTAEDPLPFRNAGPSGLHDPSEETQWARRAG